MVKTGATLFQGFDGVGIGMKAAGIETRWGIEWKDPVAQVARDNGFHSITADILTVDPHSMERVDFLHASPPCTNASVANVNAEEGELDKALGYKTAQFVEVLHPEIFTLENVWQYRNFDAFKFILTTLERLGYWIDVQHVNAADFGVPQTRKRLILRARLGGWLPNLPDPVKWVGWYEAIEDLIPTLPESHFAPWQLARLPEEYKSCFIGNGNRSAPVDPGDPADTIVSNQNQATLRDFLVNTREAHHNKGFSIRTNAEPAETLTSTAGDHRYRYRAFLAAGGNGTNDNCTRANDEPAWTVGDVNRPGNIGRAYTNGRVVTMTPRALARFQSFPDWYELPSKKSLACYGIGNAVPPLMMQRIYEQLV
jgi:DNA (cytosine-5)-methyltransferase 1